MNRPIKIVKQAERERLAEAETHSLGAGKAAAEGSPKVPEPVRNTAREAADTVKGWIGDLRHEQRQTQETTRLLLSQAGLTYKPAARGGKRKTG
jgi:hypothetical protein